MRSQRVRHDLVSEQQHGKMSPCQARSPYTSIFFHERINSFRLKIFKPNVCVCVCVCVCALVAQSCPTLWGTIDCSPPHSSVHWISQTRILEWVSISSSRGSSWPRDWTCVAWDTCIGRWIFYHYSTCVCVSCSVMSDSLQPHRLLPTRPLCPWVSRGKNTGVGFYFLLQKEL